MEYRNETRQEKRVIGYTSKKTARRYLLAIEAFSVVQLDGGRGLWIGSTVADDETSGHATVLIHRSICAVQEIECHRIGRAQVQLELGWLIGPRSREIWRWSRRNIPHTG
jgi:hypothetical protein